MLSRVLKPNVDQFSEENDDVSSDDGVRGIRFDDNDKILCYRLFTLLYDINFFLEI